MSLLAPKRRGAGLKYALHDPSALLFQNRQAAILNVLIAGQ